MSLVVNTNVPSLNAQRNLAGTQLRLSENLAHLSSGLRITRAADDAAGLAISENLKAQIRSTSQAERNANDGVSMSQVAEGGLEQMGNLLTRMRELAVQSANGTLDSTSRSFLDNEFAAMSAEIDRISQVTDFNNTMLLQGALGDLADRDAVVGVALGLGVGADLALEALADGEAGGVVGGRRDAHAGRQVREALGEAELGAGEVALSVERSDVRIDDECHGRIPFR